MNDKSRVENSIRNSVSGVAVQACNTGMGVITRTFFIRYLSAEYLGVNGLFSNILTMLSLAEMGVGGAITYSMYKPIAEKNEKKIAQLLNLYKSAYRIISIVIAVIGGSIVPFLDNIIKDKPNIDNLVLIYLLFLSNTVLSYFFAYKRSILSADQMERSMNYFTLLFHMLRYSLQIIVLVILKNFIIYLLIQVICTFLENFTISLYVDNKYPFLKKYSGLNLEEEDRKPIFENIKALFIYKIGSTALDGTDNIIISAFDGIISVGVLSNYSLITGSLQTFLNKISQGLTGSVGNFIAKENEKRYEQLLHNITFAHFVLYGMLFVGCMGSLQSFVSVWAGESYLLTNDIVFVHCLNVYIFGMMNSIWLFRSTMGLFIYGRFRPLVSAILNVVVSILLAKKMGLIGVLLGTTITRTVTNVWFDPYIVYRHGFKKNPITYYIKWLEYLAVIVVDTVLVHSIERLISLSGIVAFLVHAIISVIIFCISVFVFFGRTDSFAYLKGVWRNIVVRIVKR